jgi:hypothetical protein
MEAICSSKTLDDFYWTMWPYIPEDGIPQSHCCDNLKSNNPPTINLIGIHLEVLEMELTSTSCVPFITLCKKNACKTELCLQLNFGTAIKVEEALPLPHTILQRSEE